jgi:RNA polymerase sigma-70 factor (ECF subfamily)
MPPHRAWYRGRAHVARHLDVRCPGGPGDLRLLPVAANGQPGFALYLRDRSGGGDGVFRPFALQVLTLGPDEITHVATFLGDALFATFGLGPVAGSPADGGAGR